MRKLLVLIAVAVVFMLTACKKTYTIGLNDEEITAEYIVYKYTETDEEPTKKFILADNGYVYSLDVKTDHAYSAAVTSWSKADNMIFLWNTPYLISDGCLVRMNGSTAGTKEYVLED